MAAKKLKALQSVLVIDDPVSLKSHVVEVGETFESEDFERLIAAGAATDDLKAKVDSEPDGDGS